MDRIVLNGNEWYFDRDKQLGKGGFGVVFVGTSATGSLVAIKQLTVAEEEGGHRELEVVRNLVGRQFINVMPVLDCGHDEASDSDYVVMPLASMSLAKYLKQEGNLPLIQSLQIALDITNGLSEIPEITHRDLKPDNVLLYEENWCVADFGIARFAERATSLRTLKDCLTPHYAAPEQWKMERATSATDIYALGCIIYELFSGLPPFAGSNEELRDQHLHKPPESLGSISSHANSLVSAMLRKQPQGRPDLPRVIALLEKAIVDSERENVSEAESSLAAANESVSKMIAKAEAESEKSKLTMQSRADIAIEACGILDEITKHLVQKIENNAPEAKVHWSKNAPWEVDIYLGSGRLTIRKPYKEHPLESGEFPRSEYDVLLMGQVQVIQDRPECGRSASLYYMRTSQELPFRWWEVCFMHSPLGGHASPRIEPFFIDDPTLADRALGPGLDSFQKGGPMLTIDDEDETEFLERWISLFAQAAKGTLQRPNRLPLL